MNFKYILIIVILITIIGGGVLVWQRYWQPKEETKAPEMATQTGNEVANWKTYRSEKYGFEFRYPATWKVDEDTHIPFVQLQEVKGGEVVAIAGGITIISKPISSLMDSPYTKMFVSDSRCPVAAGSRNLSSQSQYEEYVYCLTGKEIQMSAGTWKGAIECSTSQWYGMKVDPNFCPHQFWIDTKDFFYVVHFNFFEPIKDNSDEAIFFDKFLKGFSFFAPNN